MRRVRGGRGRLSVGEDASSFSANGSTDIAGEHNCHVNDDVVAVRTSGRKRNCPAHWNDVLELLHMPKPKKRTKAGEQREKQRMKEAWKFPPAEKGHKRDYVLRMDDRKCLCAPFSHGQR